MEILRRACSASSKEKHQIESFRLVLIGQRVQRIVTGSDPGGSAWAELAVLRSHPNHTVGQRWQKMRQCLQEQPVLQYFCVLQIMVNSPKLSVFRRIPRN